MRERRRQAGRGWRAGPMQMQARACRRRRSRDGDALGVGSGAAGEDGVHFRALHGRRLDPLLQLSVVRRIVGRRGVEILGRGGVNGSGAAGCSRWLVSWGCAGQRSIPRQPQPQQRAQARYSAMQHMLATADCGCRLLECRHIQCASHARTVDGLQARVDAVLRRKCNAVNQAQLRLPSVTCIDGDDAAQAGW